MPAPSFFTRAGWLTPYALACGYIHKQPGPAGDVTLTRLDSAVYRVESWGRDYGHTGELVTPSIAAARKHFRTLVGGRLARRFEPAPDVRRNVIA